MPAETFDTLRKARVCGKALRLSEYREDGSAPLTRKRKGKAKPGASKAGKQRKAKTKSRKKTRASARKKTTAKKPARKS